jgi:hypothetical protein
MKHSKVFGLLLIAVIATQSCKKDNDTNWSEELKGSAWAGEFKYTSGANNDLQPFSIIVNSNGTISWSDLANTRPGGDWRTEGNKVTLTFPNSTTLSADLTKDSWSNFSSPTDIGFEIASLSRAEVPAAASFTNTTWIGTVTRDDGTLQDVTMHFLTGNSSKIFIGGLAYPFTYHIAGAGITINIGVISVYFNFSNNTTVMKGYHVAAGGVYRFTWDLKKQ